MAFAQQMRVEFVHIVALFTANVALPRIAVTVTALVQEVERLVGKVDATIQTQQALFVAQRRHRLRLRPGRCDRAIRCGRHGALHRFRRYGHGIVADVVVAVRTVVVVVVIAGP